MGVYRIQFILGLPIIFLGYRIGIFLRHCISESGMRQEELMYTWIAAAVDVSFNALVFYTVICLLFYLAGNDTLWSSTGCFHGTTVFTGNMYLLLFCCALLCYKLSINCFDIISELCLNSRSLWGTVLQLVVLYVNKHNPNAVYMYMLMCIYTKFLLSLDEWTGIFYDIWYSSI
jgi:hypothetical protein